MAKLDMQSLTKSMQVIGQDRLVELKLLQPGIIIGVWRVITSKPAIIFFSIIIPFFVTERVRWILFYLEPQLNRN